MNPSDVQSETEPRYFDPEEVDMSEQQFAASLDATPAKPQFEIEEAVSELPVQGPPQALEPAPDVAGAEDPAQNPEAAILRQGSEDAGHSSEPDWRSLVSAKVSSYKARKPHKERYPSLKLPFDSPVPKFSRAVQAFAPVDAPKEIIDQPVESVPQTVFFAPPPAPEPPRIIMEATARVIEFPRPMSREDELADPVIDRPRIVEAPELLPPPPAMGGILIEEEQEPVRERRPGFEVPLQPASLNRRTAAGFFDAMLVLSAVALFGYVFTRINGAVPPFRSALEIAAILTGIFWAAYQYAFLVYCGRTPGLWAAKLHLARFDGQPASRRLRRGRVLASVMSLAALGLGYAWTFLDEDQLSWHDRITRTHLAPN